MVDPDPDLQRARGSNPVARAASADDVDQASGSAPGPASRPELQQRRRGWLSVDRSSAPDLLLAIAPFVGLTVAYSYAALTWHGLGVKPGDLSVDLTSIAPSAGLLAVCVGIGALLARIPLPGHLAKLAAYVIVVAACAIAWANTAVSNLAGGVLGQAVAVIAVSLAVAKLLRWFGPDKSELPVAMQGFMAKPLPILLMFSGMGAIIIVGTWMVVGGARAKLEHGDTSSASALPMDQGPVIRYVSITVNDDKYAFLDDATCAVSFGTGPEGRVLRVVRSDGRVQLVLIEPSAVMLTAAPPCDSTNRSLVWGPLRPTPVGATTSSGGTTTAGSTIRATISTTGP